MNVQPQVYKITTMAIDPLTAIASGVNSSIKILEVTYLLKAVGEQTTDLLRTAEHVNRNINEARRLRRLKAALLNSDERAWMDSTIDDTTKALQEIGQLIEPARADAITTNSINGKTKVLWVFRDSPKVRDKHNRLSICHQSLIGVINGLYAKDIVIATPMPMGPDVPPPYNPDMEKMLNWQRQRRRRRSTANLHESRARPPSASTMPASPRLELEFDRPLSFSPLLSPDASAAQRPESICESEAASQHRPPSACDSDTASIRPVSSLERAEVARRDSSIARVTSPSESIAESVGSDGLEVVYYQVYTPAAAAQPSQPTRSPPPQMSYDFWSPVNVGLNGSFGSNLYTCQSTSALPETLHPSIEQVTSGVDDIGIRDGEPTTFERATETNAADETPRYGRSAVRSRGHQWLACYAARSNMGWKASEP